MTLYDVFKDLIPALKWLEQHPEKLITKPMPPVVTSGEKIYQVAKSLLGQDASPENQAPSALACAETVNYIVQKATGSPVGGGASTASMWEALKADSTRWESILGVDAREGDIIISPTGSNGFSRLTHGHVGIVARYGILSNNSETGTLGENYDIASWKRYYTDFGGLPTLFFRCIA